MTLTLTDLTPPPGHKRLVLAEAPQAGLRALICLHSTVLGPAAGGCRMWDYADDAAAIHDVTRLARGMTYKNAMADLGLGGGKAVIIGDARRDKTPAMMRAFGEAVDALGGTYWTAEDVGISPEDMAHAAQATRFAVGLSGASGDPSPWTAEGVFRCLTVGARHALGSDDLTGRRVLVQGLGHVGAVGGGNRAWQRRGRGAAACGTRARPLRAAMIHAMRVILIICRALVALGPSRRRSVTCRGASALPARSRACRLRGDSTHFSGFSGSLPASALSLRQVASGCERAETIFATSCVPGRALIFRQAQP